MDTGVVTRIGTTGDASITRQVRELDKDAFLKLLIAQLRNQDPMNPIEDKDFIAQLATFSSLEQMQKLNTANEKAGQSQAAAQAVALIGRQVDFASVDFDMPMYGEVTSVVFEGGAPLLRVALPGSSGETAPRVVQIDPAYVTAVY